MTGLPRFAILRPIALIATLFVAGCGDAGNSAFPGYVEGETVRLAAPIAGTLIRLDVQRGENVSAGQPAFALEQDSERAAREEAEARVASAQARLENLRKGRRPDELAALEAQLGQAQAAQTLSDANLQRQRELVAQRFVSAATLDQAESAARQNRARVEELRATLRIARQGARSDEIAAAEEELKAAQAQLAQAAWKVTQKSVAIPAAGLVNDIYFRAGEWVPAGSPVVEVQPPRQIKARFFVPEQTVGALRIGQEVRLSCDGCGDPIAARISFIAREAEYTAPILYSKENRAKLVFMVEARPAPGDATRLHPGQPLEIRLTAPAPAGKAPSTP